MNVTCSQIKLSKNILPRNIPSNAMPSTKEYKQLLVPTSDIFCDETGVESFLHGSYSAHNGREINHSANSNRPAQDTMSGACKHLLTYFKSQPS